MLILYFGTYKYFGKFCDNFSNGSSYLLFMDNSFIAPKHNPCISFFYSCLVNILDENLELVVPIVLVSWIVGRTHYIVIE